MILYILIRMLSHRFLFMYHLQVMIKSKRHFWPKLNPFTVDLKQSTNVFFLLWTHEILLTELIEETTFQFAVQQFLPINLVFLLYLTVFYLPYPDIYYSTARLSPRNLVSDHLPATFLFYFCYVESNNVCKVSQPLSIVLNFYLRKTTNLFHWFHVTTH